MDKCADTLFIMEDNGDISGFVGKCSEYIDYREEMEKEAKAKGEVSPSLPPASQSSATLSAGSDPALPIIEEPLKKLYCNF